MKIVAIGSIPLDLELACFGTLSKCIKDGHDVHIIIAKDKAIGWTQMKMDALRKVSQKIGVSQVYFTDKFDYSAVIQDNVTMLDSVLKEIDPSLVIMPFWKATNRKRKILAKTSLIACRGIGRILMYALERNSSFLPTVFFVISSEDVSIKRSCLADYGKSITEPVLNKKANCFNLNLSTMKKYPFPLLLRTSPLEKSTASFTDAVISHNNHDQQLMFVNGAGAKIEKLEHTKNDNDANKDLQGQIKQRLRQGVNAQEGNVHVLVEVFESHRMLLVDTDEF
jgi:hypothetical protein